jgi:hypothetical protein
MQLKFQRSQRTGGIIGKTVIFCLDVRTDYSLAEATNISKYKLGGQVIYNSQAAKRHLDNLDRHLDRVDSDNLKDKASGLVRGMASLALAKLNLNISIASLGRGHHIECKDLPELLDAEKTLMDACRNLKQFLEAAATFNGSIILVDFDDGEKVHIAQGALELAALLPPNLDDDTTENADTSDLPPFVSPEQQLQDVWSEIRAAYDRNPKPFYIGASVAAGIAILFLFGSDFWSLLLAGMLIGGVVFWTRRH